MTLELTERVQRPLLAGVVFLDIVGYSRWHVETQFSIKKHFNRHIGDAITSYPVEERLILDTGDGAAVCFFNRPERALLSAIRLRHATMFGEDGQTGYELRTGIHVGPVRVIRDLNGQLNVVGDGINDAQRVMSFAEAAQIMASQAFYDLVAHARPDHTDLFVYRGPRYDKHAKEHVLYEVGADSGPARACDVAAPAQQRSAPPAPRSSPPSESVPPGVDWAPDAALKEHAREVLARLIGPIADPIVRRAAQSATSPSEFHLRIAAAIDSDDDRMAFLERVGAIGTGRR